MLIGAAGFAGLAIALRQPTLTSIPLRVTTRSQPDALRRHVQFLTTGVRPRSVSHPENLERAAAYIEDRFHDAGGRATRQTYRARGDEYSNVVAWFGPESNVEPVLVVGAHYDAFGETGALPGADDNASGTAGLLEIARLLGSSDVRRPVVLVAYSTEEPPFFGSGEMGSAVHANALAEEQRAVRGMICLEMIGFFSQTQAWPNSLFALLYPGTGDFISVAGGWSDRGLTKTVKRGIAGAGGVRVVSYSGARATSDASDHRNYWSHGWPAVVVTDTAFLRNPNYHTNRDTWDTLDYTRMARVVDGVASAVLELAN